MDANHDVELNHAIFTLPRKFYARQSDLLFDCVAAAIDGGLYLEFGVHEGRSLRYLRRIIHPDIALYGFDSFNGLPEAWNDLPQGTFRTRERPRPYNTTVVEGLFAETLPGFVATHPGHVSFMNIDCDLYSSTRDVLTAFDDRLVSGTVLYFDELIGYPDWRDGEYKALIEYLARHSFVPEVIGVFAYGVGIRLIDGAV